MGSAHLGATRADRLLASGRPPGFNAIYALDSS